MQNFLFFLDISDLQPKKVSFLKSPYVVPELTRIRVKNFKTELMLIFVVESHPG